MKIAISSASFAAPLGDGSLTQLEWLEGCASRLDADGVTFHHTHFPRTDLEYAAQLRKIAHDLALVPLAVDAGALLDAAFDDERRRATLALAVALGVPFVRLTCGAPGPIPPETFVTTAALGKAFAREAKAVNVTLLLYATAGSLVPTIAEARHLVRDVDSAWIRFEFGPADLDRESIGRRDRVLIERVDLARPTLPPHVANDPLRARAWIALEGDAGPEPFARVATAIRQLRGLHAAPAGDATTTADTVSVLG